MVVAADERRQISVIVPALNEAPHISATLARLRLLRKRGHEVIVIDGGSGDDTPALAGPLADRVIIGERGRARQMNAGAAVADGDIYWFLHADTLAPLDADKLILAALASAKHQWGRFDVVLPGNNLLLRLVARLMNLRSRLSGVATGDQGLFITRSAFERIGGFEDIPIMEDIAASRALKRMSRPVGLHTPLLTSDRRWFQHGIIRTIATMWALRFAYFLGVPPWRLARYYSNHS